jgi:hypothetical protein
LTKTIKYDIINYKKVKRGKEMKTELEKQMEQLRETVESMKWENFVANSLKKEQSEITDEDIAKHRKAWKKIMLGDKK